MAITIENPVIQMASDKVAVVDNADLTRQLSIGANWTRLRVGFRWTFPNASGNITILSTQAFAFGLVSASGNAYASGSVGNFAGYRRGGSAGGVPNTVTYVYQVSGGFGRYDGSLRAESRHGSSYGWTSSQWQFYLSADPNRMYLTFMEFVKVSPLVVSAQFRHPTVAAGGAHYTKDDLIAGLSVPAMSDINLLFPNFGMTPAENLSVDEATHGPLTGFTFSWNKSGHPIWLSDVGVSKIA